MGGGGAEMLVKDLAIEFKRRGHEIGICYFSSALEQGNSVELENSFKEIFHKSGIQTIELGHAARRNPILAAFRMHKAAKQFQPDIIHIHLATGLLAYCLSLSRVKAAYTHHNVTIKFSKKLFLLFDLCMSRYVAICDICKITIEAHVRRPVVLIRNAIDDARMIKRTRRFDGRVLKILSVGYISEQKNYPLLIKTALILKSQLEVLGIVPKFQIAGDGPLIQTMRTLCNQSGVSDTVEFLGPRKDVPRLMAESDVLLMTSDYEGLPLTLIEALHTGLPIVATDVGGCNEVVIDGFNGFLRQPNDAQGLAECLVQLAQSPDRLEEMGRNSLQRVSIFSKDKCVESHLTMYNSMLNIEPV
jgi:glycosyltransferase involved in cell wall biosynthesis